MNYNAVIGLLLLQFSASVWRATAARVGATAGEVLLYEFSQSECSTGLFPNGATATDAPVLALQRDASITSCVTGAVGVESSETLANSGPRMRSTGSWADVLTKITASAEMSVEMWIKPHDISGDISGAKQVRKSGY